MAGGLRRVQGDGCVVYEEWDFVGGHIACEVDDAGGREVGTEELDGGLGRSQCSF